MSRTTRRDMGRIADIGVDRPEFKSISLEYPGHLEVVDQKDRMYLIGVYEDKWAIDCYQSMQHFLDGNSPTHTNDLEPPANADPALVVEAIAKFVQAWDGLDDSE